ncbi:MAG: AraC family transcriptional regulator [Clostridium sp.]|jgi:AraC-like DNA-binding protein|nr:AraC family transcriptional regulator [Clostridium sp.]
MRKYAAVQETAERQAQNSRVSVGAGLLGADAALLLERDGFAAFGLENETGNGLVTRYDLSPGICLFYYDLHMSCSTDCKNIPFARTDDVLEINHCREGRFECEFKGGEWAYLSEGDMSVSAAAVLKSSHFPLARYHGISILIDVPQAAKTIEELFALLGMKPLDLPAIKSRLLGGGPCFIMRGTESIEHVFSELYRAPEALKESYIKLKTVELLLFLSVAERKENDTRRYFHKTRVDAVKAMHRYMTAHMDESFTLESLSARFGIPLTAMKTCFKFVFGAPIQSYMRKYRLGAAAVMLRETDEPIANIAAKVGYDSHARFTAAFKAANGISPSDYRRFSV